MGPVSTFITGINLGQVLSTVWASVRKYWRYYLPVFLVILQALTAFGWYREHGSLQHEQAVHQADIKSYKDAQAQATAQAEQLKKQFTLASKVQADEADQNYSNLYNKYRTVLLRYQATSGSPRPTSNSEPGGATQSANGPGESADVLITAEDADTCAVNTARLQAAHDWAIKLGDKPNG